LEKHPDKIFIGFIDKTFDFFGYHFSPEGLRVAQSTLNNFLGKAARFMSKARQHQRVLSGWVAIRSKGWAGTKVV